MLLPYFEVDLDNPGGATTLFSVNNASATAILAHVVLWSDMGVPVFGFNIYLTGFDIQTINLRDVLNGTVSQTASAGQDPGDKISPKGTFSQDINFASCSGQLPPPPVPAIYQPYLRSALSGGPSSFHAGKCVGRNYNQPGFARGYVTVDTVNSCNLLFPGDPGYFPNIVVTAQNVLWGDYIYVNPSTGSSSGDTLVNVPATPGVSTGFGDPTDPETTTPGQYTFYGRLVDWTASDNREPLSTTFAAPYVGPKDLKTPEKGRRVALLPPSTEFVVWRDPKVKVNPFTCGSAPAWYPLNQEQIVAFDEQERRTILSLATPPFPAATQRVRVGSTTLPTPYSTGWMYLNLNTTVPGQLANEDPAAAQAWVTVLHHVLQGPNGGKYEAGFRALRLDSARTASHAIVP